MMKLLAATVGCTFDDDAAAVDAGLARGDTDRYEWFDQRRSQQLPPSGPRTSASARDRLGAGRA